MCHGARTDRQRSLCLGTACRHARGRVAEQGRAAAGLAATTAQMVALAWVPSIPASFAIMAAGALGNVAFPAISAIQSGLVPETEQARQPGQGWGTPNTTLPCNPCWPGRAAEPAATETSRAPGPSGRAGAAVAASCS